ncbi:MAG: 30S ribosomal protein S19e [Thaumarchaeota archaeon]|nr:30S ribosomal protein S19e [Candidatus Calditenuaceae archaeon]MDW8187028.1 30S ribosomal protein S19e [Nitrososphaerota archaeon]
MSVKLVDSTRLIAELSRHLKEKKVVTPPPWAKFAKTGVAKERPPTDPDWWYVRCASIMRKLYLKGPVGVSRLRREYSDRHRMGHRKPHTAPGSGSVVREALQQLEAANLVTKHGNKGRVLTEKGRELVEEYCERIAKSS